MIWVITIAAIILTIEIILRINDKEKMSFDLRNYPYYLGAKNKKGKNPYYIERLGKKNAPVIKTYSEGIRGDIAKEKRKIILCAGCSVTEGAAHKEADTFPGQLQNLLPEYGVINAGMGGYGIFQIKRMVERLMKYKPEAVVIQLLDFRRVPLSSKKIRTGKKKLLFYQRVKKASLIAAYLLKFKSTSYVSARKAYLQRKAPQKFLWKENKKYLDKIREICKDTKLIIFLWPSIDLESFDDSYFQKKIKEYCKKSNVVNFDAREIFKYYRKEDLRMKKDAHPSFLANKLVAKVTYHSLKKN